MILESNNHYGTELEKAIRQFEVFSENNGLLPFFSISFFRYEELKELKPYGELFFLKEITGFKFYKDDVCYYITYGANPEREVCIRLSSDFNHADAFYKERKIKTNRCDIVDLLYHGYRYRAVSTGNMMIHAAAAVYKNNGIIFCGMHAAGKSTQANLWKKHLGADIINYDQPCIIAQYDDILIHGSPWSGKEEVFRNEYAPLKAIVFVEQSNEDIAIRVSAGEAFSLIYLNNYLYPLDSTIEDKYYKVIEKIASKVPVYRLKCTMNESAVEVLYKEIFNSDYKTAKEEIK